jgi:hypothetical protein
VGYNISHSKKQGAIMNKHLIAFLLTLLTLFFSFSALAKTINLYEEPKETAKTVGTLDSNIGIIPIFTPDKGDWIKVADPRNGNVGWVKLKELGNGNTTEYTFTQRFINTGTSPQTYQIIQFGGPNKMTPEQVQLQIKQTELYQQQMQQNVNRALQNMIKDMNNLYHWNTQWFNNGTPLVMPVIVIPAQNLPANQKASTKVKTTESRESSKAKKKSSESEQE